MRYSGNLACKLVFEIEEAPLLTKKGTLDHKQMDRIAMILSDIANSGKQVVLVSAGAIAAGQEKLGRDSYPEKLSDKQALAAIGQVELIKIYQNCFDEYNQKVGQVLIARNILDNEMRVENTKNTIERLFDLNVIPIINENDTISTDDIIHENNYPLTASVANIISAELLIQIDIGEGFHIYPANSDKYWKANNTEELYVKINELMERRDVDLDLEDLYPMKSEDLNKKMEEKLDVKIS